MSARFRHERYFNRLSSLRSRQYVTTKADANREASALRIALGETRELAFGR